jgi:hypothetical protein
MNGFEFGSNAQYVFELPFTAGVYKQNLIVAGQFKCIVLFGIPNISPGLIGYNHYLLISDGHTALIRENARGVALGSTQNGVWEYMYGEDWMTNKIKKLNSLETNNYIKVIGKIRTTNKKNR